MTDARARRLAQLKQALDSGLIDPDTFQAAVAALDEGTSTAAQVNGSGAVAQGGGIAAGAGGVAVGGSVIGDVYIGSAPASGPAQPPAHASHASGWNMAAVRELVSAALGDQELTALCFDHFPGVYDEFAGGMSKGDKLQRLLEHCVRHDQVAQLVELVQSANPAQYARFAPLLKLPPSSC